MTIRESLAIADSVFTIAASGLAIYIYARKRREISAALRLLLNFSTAMSMTDLRLKLERLNDLNADDDGDRKEVVGVINELCGQIRGNKAMKKRLAPLARKLQPYAEETKSVTQARKRALVAEIREYLVTWQVEDSRRGDRDE